MEPLTFFGVSVEYFGAFRVQRGHLRSFHFGVLSESFPGVKANILLAVVLQESERNLVGVKSRIPVQLR